MLIYSMSVSVDGFIADREGGFESTAPSEELFRFHLEQVGELGGYLLGRRLYETMLVWETDPSLRGTEPGARVRRRLVRDPEGRLQPHARHRPRQRPARRWDGSDEVAAALDATDKDVSIGGAGLAAPAIERGLVDELRILRVPVAVGGGTPFLPPVTEHVPPRPDRDQDVRASASPTGADQGARTTTPKTTGDWVRDLMARDAAQRTESRQLRLAGSRSGRPLPPGALQRSAEPNSRSGAACRDQE
jgi:dihydrofolate reductase